jgi:hypothetical protein
MMRVTIAETDNGKVTLVVTHDGATTAATVLDTDNELVQQLYDAVDAFWNA